MLLIFPDRLRLRNKLVSQSILSSKKELRKSLLLVGLFDHCLELLFFLFYRSPWLYAQRPASGPFRLYKPLLLVLSIVFSFCKCILMETHSANNIFLPLTGKGSGERISEEVLAKDAEENRP